MLELYLHSCNVFLAWCLIKRRHNFTFTFMRFTCICWWGQFHVAIQNCRMCWMNSTDCFVCWDPQFSTNMIFTHRCNSSCNCDHRPWPYRAGTIPAGTAISCISLELECVARNHFKSFRNQNLFESMTKIYHLCMITYTLQEKYTITAVF
jgi:hypothetical protein